MARKSCSIGRGEYDEGSFSDIIHQYIEASTKEDLTRVKQEMLSERRLQELHSWSQGVLSEFIPHFQDRLTSIDVDSDQWHLEIDKWNWMGFILGRLGAFKWSEQIYRALYDLLCALQTSKGRIPKGTPLHQIGWVDLLRGSPDSIKRSQYYMKLAMLEDKITLGRGFKNQPAYNVLRAEHNLSGAHLERLSRAVETYEENHPGTSFLRPELIYLEYVVDRKNQERSSLYDLDLTLARELLKAVREAMTNEEKGRSLETLLAYLFLTSPGFEVLHNLVSFDAQIDLLVRNLYTTDPLLDEFGKYIIVECRNIKEKVNSKAIRDFATKVIQASCNSGILCSKRGITGSVEKRAARDARMAILKVHQRHGVIIVPLAIDQLEAVVEKEVPLVDVVISEYEKIRFDLVN